MQTYGEQYFNDTWIHRYFLFSTFDGAKLYRENGGMMDIAGARLNGISELSQILDFDKFFVENKRILFCLALGFPLRRL